VGNPFVALSLYQLKKAVLTPRTWYMRRKERDMDPVSRVIFEQNYYRKPVYEFTGATMMNPAILYDVPIDSSATVFDVGAYVGGWSQKVWDRYQPTIYAFEPAPGPHASVVEMFEGNDRVHAFDYGLGAEDATASLALAAAGSSIYDAEGTMGRVDVQIRDVVGVLEELGVEHLDVLKVNIEGGEYDLLDRLAETGWLPRIDHVLVQFHEWHPHAYRRRRRNRRALAASHEEVWCASWVWEYWRRTGLELPDGA
jgi:FkbM family methyltransferase